MTKVVVSQLGYLLKRCQVGLTLCSVNFSVSYEHLQNLLHCVLVVVAGWRGHLNIEVDHKIRGKFLGFVLGKNNFEKVQNLSSVVVAKLTTLFRS